MYPAYPALALNAAMSLHIILAAFGHSDPRTLIGKIPPRLKLLVVSLMIIGSVDVGVARIYGIYSAYSAPLKIYEPLQNGTIGMRDDSVCFGKEWYRFPSSYHLPNGMRAKFVKSEFNGLLPGEFSEAKTGFGFWSGAWLIPAGMNDLNQEDLGKYVGLMAFSREILLTKMPGGPASMQLSRGYVLPRFGTIEVRASLHPRRRRLGKSQVRAFPRCITDACPSQNYLVAKSTLYSREV